MTQNERLLDYLENGYRVNPLTAWKELGIYRLAARIADIQGLIDIKRDWLEVKNQFGELVRVREYWV